MKIYKIKKIIINVLTYIVVGVLLTFLSVVIIAALYNLVINI